MTTPVTTAFAHVFALVTLLLPTAPTPGRAADAVVAPPVAVSAAEADGRAGNAAAGPSDASAPSSPARLPQAPAPPSPLWHAAPGPSGVWPLDPQPVVVSGFDPPASPYGAGHRGVDLAGSPGQTVRAAEAGTVRFAGRLAGRGVVVVDHGATRTTYEPVTAWVGVGDPVVAGQPIGTLEAASSHCAPAACLHWGLLEGDIYLDPLTLVGAGPVRLLPLSGDGTGR